MIGRKGNMKKKEQSARRCDSSNHLILGIETSCDETAVGVVSGGERGGGRVLANAVASQIEEHRPYGGVVPEIAARAHLDKLDDMVAAALVEAGVSLGDITGIAATCGPGLIGGVMVGAMTAKAMAAALDLPFVAVNHLEAHALTVRLAADVEFPYLLLLTSGGHCQLLLARGVGDYRTLGTTRDDAAGECFDKSARIMGLGYPGGPQIERAAALGDPNAFDLPLPMVGEKGCDFSFSGLKTAVRLAAEKLQTHNAAPSVNDLAAGLQRAISAVFVDRTANAIKMLEEEGAFPTALAVAGGVAANKAVRQGLQDLATRHRLPFTAPPIELCTDNGAMVAWAGLERLRLGMADGLDFAARPRWELK